MDVAQKIRELAEAALTDPALFVVDVVVSKHKPTKVTVILDGDKGVTIDDCSDVSRVISPQMDTLNLIDDNFQLEISTPGLDHPLKLKRQFYKNQGRGMKVHLKNKSIATGTMTAVTDDKIVLEAQVKEGKKTELKTIEIPFTEIEKALVTVSFK